MSISYPYKVVNDIIATLSSDKAAQHKSALLTLHFLFPHELIPALDLLDRQLITRLVIKSNRLDAPKNEVYYVQSASATTTRRNKSSRHQATAPTAYEVRLSGWNCSCPAFTYSAFGKGFQADLNLDGEEVIGDELEDLNGTSNRGCLGGTLTRADASMPMCKHILAAFLGAAAPAMFGHGVCLREVDEVEAAGWAGGWGD